MGNDRQGAQAWNPAGDVPEGVVVGETLAGKYRVDRVLGAGGMGVVVQATHTILNTRVAMKFLLPEHAHDERVVARFLREARAAVSLKNRHVASVIDIGTLETGSPYIVMEYLEGKDLGEVIDEEGSIEPTRAAKLLLQACQGLASAHAGGVIHRDIKPGNLFVSRDVDGSEQLKILDFGISKFGQEVNDLTRTGSVMGSPMYMSPEQMRSTRSVTHRTDIWSLGVVGFEMLTGRLPYEAETMTELVAMVIEHEPPRASMLRPDLPAALDAAIAKALVKDQAERYANVAEFAADLAGALGDPMALESAARTHRIVLGGGAMASTEPSMKFVTDRAQLGREATSSFIRTRPGRDEKSRRGLFIGAAALAAVTAGVLGFMVLGRSPEPAVADVEESVVVDPALEAAAAEARAAEARAEVRAEVRGEMQAAAEEARAEEARVEALEAQLAEAAEDESADERASQSPADRAAAQRAARARASESSRMRPAAARPAEQPAPRVVRRVADPFSDRQ